MGRDFEGEGTDRGWGIRDRIVVVRGSVEQERDGVGGGD